MDGNERWNERYSNPENIYGLLPNNFLKEQLLKLAPASILLPGEGEGRNALWAAMQGWEVSAFDYSDVAQKKALALFKKHNVNVNYLLSDAELFQTHNSFDVIALIYIHLPRKLRTAFHRKLINSLKPSGKILLECFHPNQLARNSGGPKILELLPTIEELKDDFKELHISYLEKLEVNLDEGKLHQGKALVTRMTATLQHS